MTPAEEGLHFGFIDDLFGDHDDDGVGISIDADSLFRILDGDDENDQNHRPLPNDPFYPAIEGTQECGSAVHVGNNEDPLALLNYSAVGGDVEMIENPEQLLCMFPSNNERSFNTSGPEAGVCQVPSFVDTDYVASFQDYFANFNALADSPNRGLLDVTNYDMVLTSGTMTSNLNPGVNSSQASRSRLENGPIFEAQVGDANVCASEVPLFDFFDRKEPESTYGSHSINAYDSSSSSTITDEASPEPCLLRLMGQSREKQAAEINNENAETLLKGFGFNAFQRDLSFESDFDARRFLGGHHVGVSYDPSDHCHIPPIAEKTINLHLVGQPVFSEEEEHTMFQPMSINPDPVEGIQVAVESSLSEARAEDDDGDLCIVEDMSQSNPFNQSPNHEKSLVGQQCQTSFRQCSTIVTPFRHSSSGARLKAINERLVVQALVQDMCQTMSEANPPDGYLAVPLLRHQRIALSWMVQKETTSLQCSGGILADDQGLGKTVSTIALILTERAPSSKSSKETESVKIKTLNLDEDEDNQVKKLCMDDTTYSRERPSGGTLIVCPTSVLRQWAEELRHKVTSSANLSVLVYHGNNRTKDPHELAKFDVVLTTYSIISMEVPRQPVVLKEGSDKHKSDGDGVSILSSRKRKHPSNSDKKSLKRGKEKKMPEPDTRPLARVRWFRVVLDEAQSIKNYRTQVAQACWGLRAKRRWCLSGTPIQNAVDDLYSYFRFLKYDPYSVYKSFCSMVKFPINKNPSSGYRKLQAVLKTVMLRRTKATQLDGEPIISLPPKSVKLKKVEFSEEERDFYSRLEADSRAQYQEYAASGTVQQNYVNILLLLLRLRQACNHPLLVQGYNSTSELKSSIHMAKKLSQDKQSCLLSSLEASLAICHICNDPPEDAVVNVCGHVYCNECISERLSGDDNQCTVIDCKSQLNASSIFSKATLKICVADQSFHGSSHISSASEFTDQGLVEPQPAGHFDSSKIKAALEVLQSLSKPKLSLPNNVFMEPVVADSSHSDKPEAPPHAHGNEINGLGNANSAVKEKAIVFSQWTGMLDLLEARLKESSIPYRRLDGTMSVAARDKAVKDFNTLPEVTVIIMSLKAASLGLNMVAACHVLLLDLWWNPTTEDQAIDRAHRIGQTRPVTVLRLTVKDTVEDRILALQQKKRELVASAFGEDETGSHQTRLTVDDLNYLFMA